MFSVLPTLSVLVACFDWSWVLWWWRDLQWAWSLSLLLILKTEKLPFVITLMQTCSVAAASPGICLSLFPSTCRIKLSISGASPPLLQSSSGSPGVSLAPPSVWRRLQVNSSSHIWHIPFHRLHYCSCISRKQIQAVLADGEDNMSTGHTHLKRLKLWQLLQQCSSLQGLIN